MNPKPSQTHLERILEAFQGNAGAQYNLGAAYYFGKGVAQDKGIAHFWIQQAADKGNALAKEGLSKLFN